MILPEDEVLPAPPPPKAPDALPALVATVIAEMRKQTAALAPQSLQPVVDAIDRQGDLTWVFTVERDSRGFIKSVKARATDWKLEVR